MAGAQVHLLTIEDGTIRSMMSDPRFTDLLPQLAMAKTQIESIKPGKPNCKKCKKEKAQVAADAMNSAREAVRSVRGAKLASIKRLLNAEQLRIISRNSRGKRVKWTI